MGVMDGLCPVAFETERDKEKRKVRRQGRGGGPPDPLRVYALWLDLAHGACRCPSPPLPPLAPPQAFLRAIGYKRA